MRPPDPLPRFLDALVTLSLLDTVLFRLEGVNNLDGTSVAAVMFIELGLIAGCLHAVYGRRP